MSGLTPADEEPFESPQETNDDDVYPERILDRELTISQSTNRGCWFIAGALLLNFVSPVLFVVVMAITWPIGEIGIGFVGLCLGFVVSQYAGIWLWFRSYSTGVFHRYVAGTATALATTLAAIFWPLIVLSGWAPSLIGLAICGCVGLLFYWVQGLSISAGIRPMGLFLGKAMKSGRQYSIRLLLATMAVAAVLSLVGKGLAQAVSDASSGTSSPWFSDSGVLLFWMACTIPWTSLLAILKLGSQFSYKYKYYEIAWWIALLLSPLLCTVSGSLVSQLLWKSNTQLGIREILFSYAVELGYILGLALAIDLLPSQRALNERETA